LTAAAILATVCDPRQVVDLEALHRQARADGYEVVVGALILNEAARVFVHRRGYDRVLLPGCWDIVGGHVDGDETLLDALRREVAEETGWDVVGEPELLYVSDWQLNTPTLHREFDFLVSVVGDLHRPRLERPKHIEFRWLAADELDVLAENRDSDDGLVRRLVELALTSPEAKALRSDSRHAAVATCEDARALGGRAIVSDAAMTVTLDHVQLAAPRGCEAEARRFFGELLHLREIEKPEPLRARGGVWFALGDDQQLHIGVEEAFLPARKAHPAFQVDIDEIDRLAAALTRAGEVVDWDDSLAHCRRFYTADPWGNRIELLARIERADLGPGGAA
jgi:8-oxo-dGTP pyrophosphatase MutT (NUDIX family)